MILYGVPHGHSMLARLGYLYLPGGRLTGDRSASAYRFAGHPLTPRLLQYMFQVSPSNSTVHMKYQY